MLLDSKQHSEVAQAYHARAEKFVEAAQASWFFIRPETPPWLGWVRYFAHLGIAPYGVRQVRRGQAPGITVPCEDPSVFDRDYAGSSIDLERYWAVIDHMLDRPAIDASPGRRANLFLGRESMRFAEVLAWTRSGQADVADWREGECDGEGGLWVSLQIWDAVFASARRHDAWVVPDAIVVADSLNRVAAEKFAA